ncbi:MAG TPA: hypothetical protein PLD27_01165 [bacterium]|nr:hypothetical protein [bacterium]HOL46792.1 hypothetical protein [bacterium]HPQ17747.1 hypothetical protein [bacterium]
MGKRILFFLIILNLIVLSNLFSFTISDYKINGNNSLGIEFTNIDNSYYETVYSEGVAKGANLLDEFFLQTKINEVSLTGLGSFIINKEDVAFRKIFIEASKDKIILNAGDIYPQESELSLANIRIRGLKFEYTDQFNDQSYKYKIVKPLYESLETGKLIDNSLPSYYYQKKNLTRLITGLSFKTFAGYSYVSSNVNKTKGTSLPPDQFLIGIKTDLSLIANSNLNVSYIQAEDKESVAGYNKQDGSIISMNFNKLFMNTLLNNDRIIFSTELAKSKYDENTDDTEGEKDDRAYYGNLEYKYKDLSFKIKYYKYNSDFKNIGNPFIQVDKKGFLSEINYAICNTYFFNLFYEDYKNNLNNSDDTTEQTTVWSPTLQLKFPDAPEWILNYQKTKIDGENKNITISDKDDFNLTTKFNLSFFNFLLGYKHTKYDDYETASDSNSYKCNGYNFSINYSLLNNRLYLFHYFYSDEFKYKSNSKIKNNFITFNSNYQLIPNKVIINPLLEYRKSERDNNTLLDALSFQFNLDYILDYSKQIAFKFRYTDEDYSGTDLDNKIYSGRIEYKINF